MSKEKNKDLELELESASDVNDDAEYKPTPNPYKEYNHAFIEVLKNILITKYKTHFTKEEWGDGYFLFDFGEDGTLWSKIDTNKDWRFGFWFRKSESKKGYYLIQAFAQPLLGIDKFKPSRSEFFEELYIPMKQLKQAKADLNSLKGIFQDYLEYSEIIDMFEFIIKKPLDAYYIHICNKRSQRYYRLPSRLKTWLTVLKYKYTEKKYIRKNLKDTKKCWNFINKKLKPLFSEELCNANLKVHFDDCMSPAFHLIIQTCDKLYTLSELNKHLDCTYAEYLVAKWNLKQGAFKHQLSLDYAFIDDNGNYREASCDYKNINEIEENLLWLKRELGVSKANIWGEDVTESPVSSQEE